MDEWMNGVYKQVQAQRVLEILLYILLEDAWI